MKILRHVVDEADDGRMLKRIVRARLGVSHRLFSEAKFSGGLLLDGATALASAVARAGQVIEVRIPEDGERAIEPEDAPVTIAYEDDDLIVIDKPAPLPCQSSPKKPAGTLENRMAFLYPALAFRPVNRLDKGTSGLMLAAKHAHAQSELQKRLHSEDFVREYLAVAVRAPVPAEGVIDLPIAKADGATVRREVNAESGKPARTRYRVEAAGAPALLRLRLETGRTHQIRVHLSHIGCPVVGDFLYGEESPLLPGRFALHSARVAFAHPITGERMEFASPLPDTLRALFKDAPIERAPSGEDVL